MFLTWHLVVVGRVGRVGWGTARSWLTGLAWEQLGAGGGGLGFGGASLTERPTAGGGGAMAGRRFEGEDGDGVVVILFSDTVWITDASTN